MPVQSAPPKRRRKVAASADNVAGFAAKTPLSIHHIKSTIYLFYFAFMEAGKFFLNRLSIFLYSGEILV